jgi:putative ABC transport system permease protein
MAQAVRERTSELAVLKTLGFSNATVLALVLAESMFIAIGGGGLGLLTAWAVISRGDPTGGLLTPFVLPNRDLALGIGLMAAVGVASGLLPAAGAMRLRIVDALRKT